METKIIEILQSEILANRKAMLSNAEKLDQLVKAVKEETALETLDVKRTELGQCCQELRVTSLDIGQEYQETRMTVYR